MSVADTTPEPTLVVQHVSKSFGSVTAVQDASLSAGAGEVTAIIGDNGAGKSTLIKCVSGVHRSDAGEVCLDGHPVGFASPEEGRARGIETVYQDLALVDDLAVWQNLFLNRERTRGAGPIRFLDRRGMQREAESMLQRLDVDVPSVRERVRRLSGGQRQAVAICRAAGWGSRLVIMDEPTAALGVRETARVEELIRRLRDDGLAVLVISHNFDQVLRLSDRVWIMRQGRVVDGFRTAETSAEELVAAVTGAQRAANQPRGRSQQP